MNKTFRANMGEVERSKRGPWQFPSIPTEHGSSHSVLR